MSAPSQAWEMPTFRPYWSIRVMAHGYMQWVHEGRPPTVPIDFMERIIYADTEALKHFRYIDDEIEFEGKNPSGTETEAILKDLGYE